MYEENHIKSGDGTTIFCRSWKVENAESNVLLVHGYTDHSGRYESLARNFNSKNISVYSFDLRGYGQSEGEKTSISSFDEYMHDLKAVANHVNVPFYLMGHSMGGLISVKYALQNQENIKGLILSAPALIQNASASKFKIKLVLFLSKLLAKKRSKIKVNPAFLSTDKAVVDAYNNDSLVNNIGANWSFLGEFMRAMNSIPGSVSKLELPIIVFHDEKDELSNPKGSKLLVDLCASSDKSLNVVSNRGHELLQGESSNTIINPIINWITEEKRNLRKN
ncbi:MAG: hypothetical protein COA38_19625 [Fluviicola sp.]|nr:MAG: hypothetical protein COA38_19625 [Fluviicola sp.]